MDISYAREQEKLLFLIPILHTEYLHDSDTQESFYYPGMRYLICLCLVIDLYTTTFFLCSFDAFSA